MSRSHLQEPFVREVTANFLAAKARLTRRLADAPAAETAAIVEDELRGLYHGLFVIFDGGTALANEGLVQVVEPSPYRVLDRTPRPGYSAANTAPG